MKVMHASVRIDLPADEFAEAAAKMQVKPIWEAFLEALLDSKLDHAAKLETLETRAKPAPTSARRGRKPRQTLASTGVFANPPEGEAA